MKKQITISPVAVVGIIFIAIIGIVSLGSLLDKQFTANPTSQASPAQQSPDGRIIDNTAAVERFRTKLMSFEYAKQLIAGIEPGATSGVIKIQVTNFWFEFKPHQKRQFTTMLTNMWQQEASTGTVIVHIYDQTAHEVAGNSALSGVWIEE